MFDLFQSYDRPLNMVYENPVGRAEQMTCGGSVALTSDTIIIGDSLEFSWLSKKFKIKFLQSFPVEIL